MIVATFVLWTDLEDLLPPINANWLNLYYPRNGSESNLYWFLNAWAVIKEREATRALYSKKKKESSSYFVLRILFTYGQSDPHQGAQIKKKNVLVYVRFL